MLAEHDVDRQLVWRLDRLVANWLTQADYRKLRAMASRRRHGPPAKATEALIVEWITEENCRRLSHLVVGMGFTEVELPICSALRAVQSTVDYVREDRGLTQEEIEAARNELFDSADEYTELAELGMTEEPHE